VQGIACPIWGWLMFKWLRPVLCFFMSITPASPFVWLVYLMVSSLRRPYFFFVPFCAFLWLTFPGSLSWIWSISCSPLRLLNPSNVTPWGHL
jgi:hypothetical protein